MSLTKQQRKEIDTLISSRIEGKLKNYGRETVFSFLISFSGCT